MCWSETRHIIWAQCSCPSRNGFTGFQVNGSNIDYDKPMNRKILLEVIKIIEEASVSIMSIKSYFNGENTAFWKELDITVFIMKIDLLKILASH